MSRMSDGREFQSCCWCYLLLLFTTVGSVAVLSRNKCSVTKSRAAHKRSSGDVKRHRSAPSLPRVRRRCGSDEAGDTQKRTRRHDTSEHASVSGPLSPVWVWAMSLVMVDSFTIFGKVLCPSALRELDERGRHSQKKRKKANPSRALQTKRVLMGVVVQNKPPSWRLH